MNRRQFLKTLLAGAVGSTLDIESSVDQLLSVTNHLDDSQFVTYIHHFFQIHVDNPRACGYITNIVE